MEGRRERDPNESTKERFDQINTARPQTLAVGCPFCMSPMEDAVKSRSLEESMRVRDLAGNESIAVTNEPQLVDLSEPEGHLTNVTVSPR